MLIVYLKAIKQKKARMNGVERSVTDGFLAVSDTSKTVCKQRD